jgi:hypothetical protein
MIVCISSVFPSGARDAQPIEASPSSRKLAADDASLPILLCVWLPARPTDIHE